MNLKLNHSFATERKLQQESYKWKLNLLCSSTLFLIEKYQIWLLVVIQTDLIMRIEKNKQLY